MPVTEMQVRAQFAPLEPCAMYNGSSVSSNATVREALAETGMDWRVVLRPLLFQTGEIPGTSTAVGKPIPNQFATVKLRPDEDPSDASAGTALGTVKTKYRPLQNEEAFDWLNDVHRHLGGDILTAGQLHGGKSAYMVYDVTGWEVFPGDEIRIHLVLLNNHDGTINSTILLIPYRVVSGTMLTCMSYKNGGLFRLRHTAPVKGAITQKTALRDADRKMAHINDMIEYIRHWFTLFGQTTISLEEQQRLIYAILDVSDAEYQEWRQEQTIKTPQWANIYEEIEAAGQFAPGAESGRGTIWHTFNAICGWHDRMRTVRGAGQKPDNVLEAKLIGYSAQRKLSTFELCSELASGRSF
jgi:hypothetical protein